MSNISHLTPVCNPTVYPVDKKQYVPMRVQGKTKVPLVSGDWKNPALWQTLSSIDALKSSILPGYVLKNDFLVVDVDKKTPSEAWELLEWLAGEVKTAIEISVNGGYHIWWSLNSKEIPIKTRGLFEIYSKDHIICVTRNLYTNFNIINALPATWIKWLNFVNNLTAREVKEFYDLWFKRHPCGDDSRDDYRLATFLVSRVRDKDLVIEWMHKAPCVVNREKVGKEINHKTYLQTTVNNAMAGIEQGPSAGLVVQAIESGKAHLFVTDLLQYLVLDDGGTMYECDVNELDRHIDAVKGIMKDWCVRVPKSNSELRGLITRTVRKLTEPREDDLAPQVQRKQHRYYSSWLQSAGHWAMAISWSHVLTPNGLLRGSEATKFCCDHGLFPSRTQASVNWILDVRNQEPFADPEGVALEELHNLIAPIKDSETLLVQLMSTLLGPLQNHIVYHLMITGEQEVGKSKAVAILQSIVSGEWRPDPVHTVSLSDLVSSSRDLAACGKNRSSLVVDNIRSMGKEEMDMLCRLATGESRTVRRLFTEHSTETRLMVPFYFTSVPGVPINAELARRMLRVKAEAAEHKYKLGSAEMLQAISRVRRALYQLLSGVQGDALPKLEDFLTCAGKVLGKARSESEIEASQSVDADVLRQVIYDLWQETFTNSDKVDKSIKTGGTVVIKATAVKFRAACMDALKNMAIQTGIRVEDLRSDLYDFIGSVSGLVNQARNILKTTAIAGKGKGKVKLERKDNLWIRKRVTSGVMITIPPTAKDILTKSEY